MAETGSPRAVLALLAAVAALSFACYLMAIWRARAGAPAAEGTADVLRKS
ncbi:hypothetical protein [Massilia sp. Se16.2.3]|nr:hypothetical protein [Massilia sp. Se16.2.3]QNA99134.1 hypothetical protein G4G31_10195 [Massilia sp. Se16.2.3]